MAKKETKELVARKISQPNAFDNNKRLEQQSSDALFYKNKGYLSYNCSQWGGTTQKSFRQWEHPTNIIEGKKTQCGTTEKHYGSKNEVQHIGSPTGDIPRPAMLHMYNFKKSFIGKNSEIHDITITFSYRVVNVTDKGKLWINNLTDSELAKIQGCKAWFGTWDQSKKFSEVKNNKTVLKYEGKNKQGYIWKTITMKFTDISASDILDDDFAFNLQFGMNCSKASTPCFLYINNFKIKVTHTPAISKKYIEGKNSKNSLYTSKDTECFTTITQTIEAGYKDGDKKVPVSEAPAKLGKKIKVYKKPSDVDVNINTSGDKTSTFTVTDKTNIAGEKTITYCLDNDESTKVSVKYKAIKREKPTYQIIEKYKSFEDFDDTKAYIVFKNGCASPKIKIYVDDINSTPLELDVVNQNSSSNLLGQEQITAFHNYVKTLPCGYHTLYIQRGNESIADTKKNAVIIQILPMEYRFKIYSENNLSLTYPQSKSNDPNYPRYAPIKIQRIDDEPRAVIPSVSILDETNLTGTITHWENVEKGAIYQNNNEDYKVDLYYPGEFYLTIVEDNNTCVSQNPSSARITVEPHRKQNYDYLFTRGENATAFDFKYLVAWEGDNVKSPITMSNIGLKHFLNDIRICSNPKETGLSQIGLIELKVSNRTQNDDFKNIKIELNTLIKNDNDELEVTTNEWVTEQGIFNNFYQLFYEYNVNDNVTVENLTPDSDLIDEENVYLHIDKIPAGDTVSIYLPFRSAIEKTVYLQYLIFEQPHDIYNIGACDAQTSNTSTEIRLDVIDSVQTQLSITGNTDLLNLDTSFECPNECYTTVNGINDPNYSNSSELDPQSGGITYTIRNVDTNDLEEYVTTEIINSNEMQPYGYYLNDVYYNLYNNDGTPNTSLNTNRVKCTQVEEIFNKSLVNQLLYAYVKFPASEEEVLIEKTNSKGLTTFYIKIPAELNRSYTVKELLTEVLYIKYKGKDRYNPFTLAEFGNTFTQHDNTVSTDNDTLITYTNNYRRYQPGETAIIPVSLTAKIKVVRNKIIFKAFLGDSGTFDELTVLYQICNIKDNQGVFKTIFKTADEERLLIPQQISKNVYCGIDTVLDLDSRLEKEIVEKENLNILYLNIANKDKINKDVYIEIDLGPKNNFPGDYNFIDIHTDAGDYAINNIKPTKQSPDHIVVTWLLGEMQSYQRNNAIIKIQADDIGLSDIKINAFDYIHNKNYNIPIRQSKCPKCDEETTYTLANSAWKQFEETQNGQTKQVWYKLINNRYYKRELVDGELKWIEKL